MNEIAAASKLSQWDDFDAVVSRLIARPKIGCASVKLSSDTRKMRRVSGVSPWKRRKKSDDPNPSPPAGPGIAPAVPSSYPTGSRFGLDLRCTEVVPLGQLQCSAEQPNLSALSSFVTDPALKRAAGLSIVSCLADLTTPEIAWGTEARVLTEAEVGDVSGARWPNVLALERVSAAPMLSRQDNFDAAVVTAHEACEKPTQRPQQA